MLTQLRDCRDVECAHLCLPCGEVPLPLVRVAASTVGPACSSTGGLEVAEAVFLHAQGWWVGCRDFERGCVEPVRGVEHQQDVVGHDERRQPCFGALPGRRRQTTGGDRKLRARSAQHVRHACRACRGGATAALRWYGCGRRSLVIVGVMALRPAVPRRLVCDDGRWQRHWRASWELLSVAAAALASAAASHQPAMPHMHVS
jgi:hypothetical protein